MKADIQVTEEFKKLIPDEAARVLLLNLIHGLPGIVALLDENRKLVFSNQSLLDAISIDSFEEAFQLRPGDLFKCVNADIGPDGCGSSEACQLCGALRAMEESRVSKETYTSECRILSTNADKTKAYNFRFTSTPFFSDSNMYFVITIEDISGQTRKAELEKIFFHDVFNSLAGFDGVIDLLKRGQTMGDTHLRILEESYNTLARTVKEQKDFSQAEAGELVILPEQVNSLQMIRSAVSPFEHSNKYPATIELVQESISMDFITDSALLSRILTNMLKNALEASTENEVVRIWAEKHEQGIEFKVSNPAYIPRADQLQIFERSFSTKGKGRGLGTYSMKLLGEDYLGGKVDFKSEETEGTTFSIQLPAEPKP